MNHRAEHSEPPEQPGSGDQPDRSDRPERSGAKQGVSRRALFGTGAGAVAVGAGLGWFGRPAAAAVNGRLIDAGADAAELVEPRPKLTVKRFVICASLKASPRR